MTTDKIRAAAQKLLEASKARNEHYTKMFDAYSIKSSLPARVLAGVDAADDVFGAASHGLRIALAETEPDQRSPLPPYDSVTPDTQRGLYEKFNVSRTDGSSHKGGKHHGCEYFVLDVTHDKHAPAALAAYASSVSATHPKLAADMRTRWGIAEPAQAAPAEDCAVWDGCTFVGMPPHGSWGDYLLSCHRSGRYTGLGVSSAAVAEENMTHAEMYRWLRERGGASWSISFDGTRGQSLATGDNYDVAVLAAMRSITNEQT